MARGQVRQSQRWLSRPLTLVPLLASLITATVHGAAILPASSPHRISATAAGHSQAPLFAADGTRVIFLSHAPNLVTNEDLGPHLNLFVRTFYTPPTTTLISVSTNGHSGANASVLRYDIGSIGLPVVFETAASNLTANDTNNTTDIFLHGPENRVRLVSINAAGTAPGNGRSFNPRVSRYGDRVVFESEASDLVPNDTNGVADVFVRQMPNGPTRLVSVNAAGTGSGNGPSGSAYLSEYGSYVAFVSRATDLVSGVTNTLGEVYVRSLESQTTRWARAGLTGNSAPCLRTNCTGWPDGYVPSDPVTFDSGQVVVFKLGSHSVIRWQFASGGATVDDERVHRVDHRAGERLVDEPIMVGFEPSLVGYVVGRTNATGQFTNSWLRRIDFRSQVEGIDPGTGLPGLVYAAQNVVSGPLPDGLVHGPTMSSDGSRFFFASDSTRLLAQPTDGSTQIYSHEMGAASSTLISARPGGGRGPDLNGVLPTATRSGREVAWETPDPSLVANDDNDAPDVFLRAMDNGSITLVSVAHTNRPATTGLRASRIGPGGLSGHGRVVAFTALDTTFVAGDTNRLKDAFALNVATGTRSRLTATSNNAEPWPPALNADGRFAVFEQATFTQGTLGVTNSYRADLLSNIVATVGRNPTGQTLPAGHPSMSADGRFVAFHSAEFAPNLAPYGPGDANPVADVFLRDYNPSPTNFPRTDTFVASIARHRSSTGNAESRAPTVSPDGRWIAFHSLATDLTYDSFPAARHQVFAYDHLRRAVKLLSYTPNPPGSNATALSVVATNPVFSADARFVFFTVHSNLGIGQITQAAIVRHDLLNDPIVTVTNWTNGTLVFSRTNLARATNTLICTGCANPVPSTDGRWIAYEAAATDGTTNAVVHDLQSGLTEFISPHGSAPGPAHRPALSWDGRYVVFTSADPGPFPDANQASDVYLHDRRTRITYLLSRTPGGPGPSPPPVPAAGSGRSDQPVMSADGRTVAFQSFAPDLVSGDFNDTRDVFVATLGGEDRDGDGMDDNWEVAYFSSLAQSGAMDFDSDGQSNRDEYLAGTDPTNTGSVFEVLTVTLATQPWPLPARVTVLWSAVPARSYRIQTKPALDAPWQDIAGDVVAVTASASKTFDVTSPPRAAFFRAVLVP